MDDLFFRNATPADLPQIVAIYNSTVASRMVTADTEPVTVEDRIGWFNEHHTNRPLWIVEGINKNILGWVSFQDFYGRPAYSSTAEISMYLHASERGKGYGKKILSRGINTAPALGIKNLIAFIFLHNTISLHLFEQGGFSTWGILPDVAVLDDIERSLQILGMRVF